MGILNRNGTLQGSKLAGWSDNRWGRLGAGHSGFGLPAVRPGHRLFFADRISIEKFGSRIRWKADRGAVVVGYS